MSVCSPFMEVDIFWIIADRHQNAQKVSHFCLLYLWISITFNIKLIDHIMM